MTKGKLLTLGAVAGAIIMTVFGFGIYGIVSCSSREYVERRIKDSKNDEYYKTFVAQVVDIEQDKDFTHVRLSSEKSDYKVTIVPETNKFFQENDIELKLGESYTFTVFTAGEPLITKPIAAISSEDGEHVYISYEQGKQMVTDYFISLKD